MRIVFLIVFLAAQKNFNLNSFTIRMWCREKSAANMYIEFHRHSHGKYEEKYTKTYGWNELRLNESQRLRDDVVQ